jgi:DNA-binding transcriptional LysR family regulator
MEHEPWFGVELRHLAALSAVAREGSFRGAAESLGYVQSAVSQQVANLERLVEVRLVDRFRGSKEVHLTEAGELLLAHAEDILTRLQAAQADIAAHADGGGPGTLQVGVFQSAATGLLPSVMRRLAGTAPELRVAAVEATTDEALFGLVERGAIDIAFGELPLLPGHFESHAVLCDPWVLLVPASSELAARKDPLALDELAAQPLIALEDCRSMASLETWFGTQGVAPNVTLRAANEATARAFVAAELGSAIVPRLATDPDDRRTAVVELPEAMPPRRLALYWHSERRHGAALERFRSVTADVALDLTGRGSNGPPEPVEAPVALVA